MSGEGNNRADRVIGLLAGLGPLRVWSVVITIFGDHARCAEDEIPARQLRRLVARLGIRDDALRVALHRLKNDGWIIARRSGRTSSYRLTARAFAECAAARPRIYAAAAGAGCDPVVIVAPPGKGAWPRGDDDRDSPGALRRLAPRIHVGCRGAVPPEDCLVAPLTGEPLPLWFRQRMAPRELVEGYARLEAALREVVGLLGSAAGGLPADGRNALRVLTIHRWRQLLLRHPDLPESFFPPGWQGESCRRHVREILRALPALEFDDPAPA